MSGLSWHDELSAEVCSVFEAACLKHGVPEHPEARRAVFEVFMEGMHLGADHAAGVYQRWLVSDRCARCGHPKGKHEPDCVPVRDLNGHDLTPCRVGCCACPRFEEPVAATADEEGAS